MFKVWKQATVLAMLFAGVTAMSLAAEPAGTMPEGVEVIVVTSTEVKVPLWQVSNGDKTMWILAYVNVVPKDIQWNFSQVEQVIAASQEYIRGPSINGSASPLLYLNPINIVRGMRLIRRLQKSPDDKTLAQIVPAGLYQRYFQIKTDYFPKDEDIELHRPLFAGPEMTQLMNRNNKDLPQIETITDPIWPLLERVDKLVKRNRAMERTNPEAEIELGARYGVLAERAQTMLATLPLEEELRCFEHSVNRIEKREQLIAEALNRASAWAYNDIEALAATTSNAELDPCESAVLASSEGGTITGLLLQSREQWLNAVERALTNNASTFATLSMSELLGEGGLLQELQARGYAVREPG